MFKLVMAFLVFGLSATAFADSFKIVTERTVVSPEGTTISDGLSYVTEKNLFPIRSGYSLRINYKKINSSNRVVYNEDSDSLGFVDHDIKLMRDVFSQCEAWNGQIENLTIKAGTFKACKRTFRTSSEWSIENFPFLVKILVKNKDGSSYVYEATQIENKK